MFAERTDCHTSDSGHWFAMTAFGFCRASARRGLARRGWRPRQPVCVIRHGTSGGRPLLRHSERQRRISPCPLRSFGRLRSLRMTAWVLAPPLGELSRQRLRGWLPCARGGKASPVLLPLTTVCSSRAWWLPDSAATSRLPIHGIANSPMFLFPSIPTRVAIPRRKHAARGFPKKFLLRQPIFIQIHFSTRVGGGQ